MKPTIAAAIRATVVLALGFATPCLAQQAASQPPRPAAGMGSKTMASCNADTRKYCPITPGAVLKECLVRNWDRISSDCQEALATPLRPRRPAPQRAAAPAGD